jgi:hypothetical protein
MKQQLILIAVSLAYWTVVGVILVAIVNAWPWLTTSSPWLFAVFVPFFVLGLAMRMILRKRLLNKDRIQP